MVLKSRNLVNNFLKFLSPSRGSFYNLTVNWARRPTFLLRQLRFHSILPNTSRPIFDKKTRLVLGNILWSRNFYQQLLGLRAQFSVRLQKCPGGSDRNFLKNQVIFIKLPEWNSEEHMFFGVILPSKKWVPLINIGWKEAARIDLAQQQPWNS